MLDVLSACALIALIMAYAYQANEHINTSLKINKVRTAAETFAQDLRKLQRNTMFQSSGGALSIKIIKTSEYHIYDGLVIKKTVDFNKTGCEGVFFSKKLNTGRFMPIGAPVYTGDYELRHKDLPNFSCTLSIQPVTGRIVINEGK